MSCMSGRGYFFVTVVWLSFLKRVTVLGDLHYLQIVPGDAWRVKFLEFDVIPDGLAEVPNSPLQVNFDNGGAAEFGNILLPAQTRSAPIFINTTTDLGCHILMMTDLDYPSPRSRERREYLHWMVSNINHVHLSDGDVLAEYVSPSNSDHHGGTHRYMLTFFRQPEGVDLDLIEFVISEDEINDPERTKFSTRTFIKQCNLSLPFAANFFRISWPEEPDKIPEEYSKRS